MKRSPQTGVTGSPKDETETRITDQNQGFLRAVASQVRLLDLFFLAVVPVVLVGVSQLPVSVREQYVFDITDPTLMTAYTSHFIHLQNDHLLGNLSIYLLVAPITYCLCVLSGRDQLFRITLFTLLGVFPFVLSGLQLIFPREREIFGFSGINAALFGLLCLAVVLYLGHQFTRRAVQRYAPGLLLVTLGMIALISLPSRGWRIEIAAVSLALGVVYLVSGLYTYGFPSRAELVRSLDQRGYMELAGAGFGLVFAYPFVGFGERVVAGEGVVDVYVHLLGYSLAFIVVFIFLVVSENE